MLTGYLYLEPCKKFPHAQKKFNYSTTNLVNSCMSYILICRPTHIVLLNLNMYQNKYAIYAYTHGPVTGSGFLLVSAVCMNKVQGCICYIYRCTRKVARFAGLF